MRIFKELTKRWGILYLTLSIPLLVTVGTAEAGVKTIWPEKFIPVWNNQNSNKAPGWAASGYPSGAVLFYANIKLPIGAEITGLRHFHRGTGLSPGTTVRLLRVKMGQFPEGIIESDSADGSNTIVTAVGTFFPGVNRFVRPGFRYYVNIHSDNNESTLWGIKIFYE